MFVFIHYNCDNTDYLYKGIKSHSKYNLVHSILLYDWNMVPEELTKLSKLKSHLLFINCKIISFL